VEQANQVRSAAKGELLAAVQAQGYLAPHAEKTTRLEGVIYIADSTVGSTIDIDEATVKELQAELSRAKKPRIFGQLFQTKTSHTLLKGAAEILAFAIGGMKQDAQTHLLGIFSRCFKVDSKAPSLSVTLATVLRKKEEKAAAKAARTPRAKK